MSKHTPEPWSDAPLSKGNIIIKEADWFRAVACVNAMQGIENPSIYMSQLAYERDRAKMERDLAETQSQILLNALKSAKDVLVMVSLIDKSNTCDKAVKDIELTIKKVIREQP